MKQTNMLSSAKVTLKEEGTASPFRSLWKCSAFFFRPSLLNWAKRLFYLVPVPAKPKEAGGNHPLPVVVTVISASAIYIRGA